MARDGSGTFNRLFSWVTERDAGNPIDSTDMDSEMDGMATALTDSIAKNGETTPTANLKMGGFLHTNVAAGTARNHYAAISQVQDGSVTVLGSVSGTDTITGTLTPTLTAYAAGQVFTFAPAGVNTGAVTLNINSVGAKAIVTPAGDALEPGDIGAGTMAAVVYDGTDFVLLNQSIPKTNIDATAAPGASNDTTEGYSAGSVWVDVTNDNAYICVDASTAAAIWSALGNPLHKFDATTAPGASNDTTEGYSVGSRWGDTSADAHYVCVDATTSTAIWKRLTSPMTTTGDMVYRSSSDEARLAIGSANQYLVSNGTQPFWNDYDGWRFVEVADPSAAASVSFTDLDANTAHMFSFSRLRSSTDNERLNVVTSDDAGGSPTFATGASDYAYICFGQGTGTTSTQVEELSSAAATGILIPALGVESTSTQAGINGYLVFQRTQGTVYQHCHGQVTYFDTAIEFRSEVVAGVAIGADALGVVAIRFNFTSGNMTGKIEHYERTVQ